MLKKITFTCSMLLLLVTLGFGQRDSQDTRLWDMYAGPFDTFWIQKDSSTTSDSLWFNYSVGSDSVFYSEVFKGWPYGSLDAIITDSTVATDSLKFIVWLLQSGESTDTLAATSFKKVRVLSWRSTTSDTETDTLTAVGRYSANITDEPVYVARWSRISIECFLGNKKLVGNYGRFVYNGWNITR